MKNDTPKLIIFDCDGVLIDSERLATQVFIEVAAEYGVNLNLDDVLTQYVGLSSATEMADIEARYKIKLPVEYLEKKRRRQKDAFKTGLKAMPGIEGLLEKLEIGKCVASSSSPDRLQYTLGLTKLWDHFAPNVFSSAQVAHGKPAPDLFLFAARNMKVDPSCCLVIEDSVPGVQAAIAAGMNVLGFAGGSHCGEGHGDRLRHEGAENIFHHMDDLSAFLSTIINYNEVRDGC